MIVNANKFQAVIMGKRRDHTSENILIDQKNVKVLSTIKLLGVQLDDKLNLNLHINDISKSSINQLNAMVRSKTLLSFVIKNVLINSYFCQILTIAL